MCKRIPGYFRKLMQIYGLKFLTLEIFVFCFLYGFLRKTITINLIPYFLSIGVDAKSNQIYLAIIWSSWNFQVLVAMLSELYPLLNYERKYYMIFSAILGSVALAVASIFDFRKIPDITPFLLFVTMLEIVFLIILMEGKYIQLANQNVHYKRHMLTWVSINIYFGSFCGNYVGVFVEKHDPKWVFVIGTFFAAVVIFPLFANFLPENRFERVKFDVEKFRINKRIYLISIVICLVSTALNIVSIFKNTVAILISLLAAIFILFGLIFVFLDREFAKLTTYAFMHNGFFLLTKGARDLWFTVPKSCIENAPHFSFSFYYTYSQFVGNVAAIVASIIFQIFFKKLSVEKCYLVSTILRLIGFIPELLMMFRWNVPLKIPDSVLFIIGNEVLYGMAFSFQHVGTILLIAYRGGSTIICAFFFAMVSVGFTFSKMLSVVLINLLNVNASRNGPCDFDLFWVVRLIGMGLLPLVSIPFLYFLVPRIKISEVKKN